MLPRKRPKVTIVFTNQLFPTLKEKGWSINGMILILMAWWRAESLALVKKNKFNVNSNQEWAMTSPCCYIDSERSHEYTIDKCAKYAKCKQARIDRLYWILYCKDSREVVVRLCLHMYPTYHIQSIDSILVSWIPASHDSCLSRVYWRYRFVLSSLTWFPQNRFLHLHLPRIEFQLYYP